MNPKPRRLHGSTIRWLRSRRTLAAFASLLVVVLGAPRARAQDHDGLILEVSPDAARLVEPRVTERLIVLETADVDVPAPPGVTFRPPLYFRILPLSSTSVRVELWELGQSYGARSVSTVGSDHLKARRIALAAAELARQLRQRRLAELGAASHATGDDAAHAGRASGVPIYGRFVWSAGARGAAIGGAHAWLVGPEFGATLRFDSGQRLSLGAAWLAGEAPLVGSSSARWLEAGLTMAQTFSLNRTLAVDLGLSATAASVRMGGAYGPLDTWSARGGLIARLDARLGRYWGLAFGPDIGAVLRPIPVVSGSDRDPRELGGVWLGGTVTVSVDPGAP